MKKAIVFLVTILFVMAGCGENKQLTDDFVIVDVTKSYPKKELILQDFLDVEYIPLETNDEFVTSCFVQAIGEEIILVRDLDRTTGNIFIFDRKGKGLKKINKRIIKNLTDVITEITIVNNDEIAFMEKIEAFELVEAYEKGQLKGKLKDIAAELDEESNPVIMLAKYKKK